jgi:inositol phosphorylceramide synthase catalytic subunit
MAYARRALPDGARASLPAWLTPDAPAERPARGLISAGAVGRLPLADQARWRQAGGQESPWLQRNRFASREAGGLSRIPAEKHRQAWCPFWLTLNSHQLYPDAINSRHMSCPAGSPVEPSSKKSPISEDFIVQRHWHTVRSILASRPERASGDIALASALYIKRRPQPWQLALSAGVFIYLAFGVATSTVRPYHWFLLLIIPTAFMAAEGCRRFFLDWAPLIAFWLIYDRLRLLQPFLLYRVAVAWPYQLERWLFGGLTGGDVPAHAGRAWLAAQSGTILGATLSWTAQMIYLSHIVVVPLLFLWLWIRGRSELNSRKRFHRMMRAFTYLNFAAIIIYLLIPAAPPWWVSLYGTTQPTTELLAQLKMSAAMDGKVVTGLIKNAAQWFAAIPSVHGAYPVLLALLALRDRSRWEIAALTVYALGMWWATVVLNQHYLIDLLAGGLLATLAWAVNDWRARRTTPIAQSAKA